MSALGGYFVYSLVLWGHAFCLLSNDRRLSVSRRLKMYYFYGKINWGHVVCPLYGGGLYLGESVMRGSTVISNVVRFHNSVLTNFLLEVLYSKLVFHPIMQLFCKPCKLHCSEEYLSGR